MIVCAKDEIAKVVSDQPADSTFDDIMRELVFTQMIDRGLEDSENGNTISNEEMQKEILSWSKQSGQMNQGVG